MVDPSSAGYRRRVVLRLLGLWRGGLRRWMIRQSSRILPKDDLSPVP